MGKGKHSTRTRLRVDPGLGNAFWAVSMFLRLLPAGRSLLPGSSAAPAAQTRGQLSRQSVQWVWRVRAEVLASPCTEARAARVGLRFECGALIVKELPPTGTTSQCSGRERSGVSRL